MHLYFLLQRRFPSCYYPAQWGRKYLESSISITQTSLGGAKYEFPVLQGFYEAISLSFFDWLSVDVTCHTKTNTKQCWVSDVQDPSKVWYSLAIAISDVLDSGAVSLVEEPGNSATPTHSGFFPVMSFHLSEWRTGNLDRLRKTKTKAHTHTINHIYYSTAHPILLHPTLLKAPAGRGGERKILSNRKRECDALHHSFQ